MNCGDCGSVMYLKKSRYGRFFGCSRYPECRGSHSVHPDGSPMGIPGDKETREWRQRLHDECERVWGPFEKISQRQKNYMYQFLRDNAPKMHISEMNIEECKTTIEIVKILKRQF